MYTKVMTPPKVIAVVGMAGSGKGTIVDHLTETLHIPKVYVGGFIVEGVKALGQEVTEENERRFREEMRAQHGKEYFMKQAIERMKEMLASGTKTIALDGLYTWTEYKLLDREFSDELKVIAVVAPKELRYDRLANRSLRPLSADEAKARDWGEIENIEKGGPIAIADEFIINDAPLETLKQTVNKLCEELGLKP